MPLSCFICNMRKSDEGERERERRRGGGGGGRGWRRKEGGKERDRDRVRGLGDLTGVIARGLKQTTALGPCRVLSATCVRVVLMLDFEFTVSTPASLVFVFWQSLSAYTMTYRHFYRLVSE